MDADAVFALVADRRRAVADLVDSLSPAELATPSLCVGWDVLTVAAHLTVVHSVGPLKFAGALVRNGGSFHRANNAVAIAAATAGASEVAATLRRGATSRATPPVGGPRAPLTDLVVHEADMVLPLGRPFEPPADATSHALDFLTEAGIGFVPRGRLAGLRLVATDLDRAWGDGVEVSGRSADLVIAACGRRPGFDGLAGPGAQLLASRLTASPSPPDR